MGVTGFSFLCCNFFCYVFFWLRVAHVVVLSTCSGGVKFMRFLKMAFLRAFVLYTFPPRMNGEPLLAPPPATQSQPNHPLVPTVHTVSLPPLFRAPEPTYPVSLVLVISPLFPVCLPLAPPSTTNLSIWKKLLNIVCLCTPPTALEFPSRSSLPGHPLDRKSVV